MRIIADRRISKESFVRIQDIMLAYGSSCFNESLFASSLTKRPHSSPIPPFVPSTSGVNVACSTSSTLCKYSRFLLVSCSLNIVLLWRFLFDAVLTCLIFNKIMMSDRDSKSHLLWCLVEPLNSFVLAVLRSNLSFSNGMRWGSVCIFTHTLSSNAVNRSRTLSWRFDETKPPILHERACVALNGSPQAQKLGNPSSGTLYRRRNASLNSCLFRSSPWSFKGIAFNQELAPFSLAWLTKDFKSVGKFASTLTMFSFKDTDLLLRCNFFKPLTVLYYPHYLCPGTVTDCPIIVSTCGFVIRVDPFSLWQSE